MNYTCVACMDQSEDLHTPGWLYNDNVSGICCPSCLAAEKEGYVLFDYYDEDRLFEQNTMDAYDSYREVLAAESDRANTDPYHGRN